MEIQQTLEVRSKFVRQASPGSRGVPRGRQRGMCAGWLAAVLTPTGTTPASGGAGAEIWLAMLSSGENGIGA